METIQALNTTYQKATFGWRYDADGTVWAQAVAAAALTAKTPVLIIADEYGPITQALSDVAVYALVGVPAEAADAGDVVWLQIGGFCEDVICPSLSFALGHAAKIHDGAIADVGADYSGGASEFGVCAEATTTLTTVSLMLVPRQILTTT